MIVWLWYNTDYLSLVEKKLFNIISEAVKWNLSFQTAPIIMGYIFFYYKKENSKTIPEQYLIYKVKKFKTFVHLLCTIKNKIFFKLYT